MSKSAECKEIINSSLGADLDTEECQILSNIMGERHLKSGDLLVPEGGSEQTLFLLVEGKLSVTSLINDQAIVVYNMSPGECAGTRAFIDRTPRKATLRAVGNTTVYTLEPDAFESLLDTHPQVVYHVMRALFRITHTNLMRMNRESQQLSNYISKTGGRY